MERDAWWSTVHGVTKSQKRLSDFHFTSLHLLSIFRSWITGSKLLSYFSACSLDSIQSLCDLTCQRSCHSTGSLNLGCGFCIFLFTVLNYVSLIMLPLWPSWWRIHLKRVRPGFDSWVGKISWRRKWHPTPVFLPGKSHGWRNLVGYSPWGHKESETTEWLSLHLTSHTSI